jgi:lipoate-protein ligase A
VPAQDDTDERAATEGGQDDSHPSVPPTIGRYDADDALLAAVRADGITRLAVTRPPAPLVVLGAGSRPERELHLDAIAADGVPVARRAGGGCSVVLDPGNVVVALAVPAAGLPGIRTAFDWISAFVIDGLARLGLSGVTCQGVSDLALGDRKIAGACVHADRALVHYSVTLLADPDLSLLPRYLKHPPREPAYRRSRGHLDFVRALADVDARWSAPRLAAALESVLAPADLLCSPFPERRRTD